MSERTALRERGIGPWRLGDLYLLYAALSVGAIAVVVSWYAAGGTGRSGTQTTCLSVAIGGVVVSGTGIALWLVSGYRALGLRQRRLAEHPVAVRARLATSRPAATAPDPVADVTAAELVASPVMTRYHLRGCALADGKPVRARSQAAHLKAGLRPCGVCLPGSGTPE